MASMMLTCLFADIPMEHKIGQMLMIGFHGTSAKPDSQICQDIRDYDVGAVILFDYNPIDKSKPKNIANKAQVARLTKELQACSGDGRLLIAVDQEGGRVQRLKSAYGFYGNFPKAADVVKAGSTEMKNTYSKMAQELRSVGINYDLAPVVDLDINPKNHVIHGLGRSFGKDPKIVAKYASIFIDAMHQYGILTSLKHFPGHGSSVGDTHKGFVDVTNLWQPQELEPYQRLKDQADSVMVAHVFNR
ncbi:MAG: glycosyl hydrolase, partial [Sulfurovum sp.]